MKTKKRIVTAVLVAVAGLVGSVVAPTGAAVANDRICC